MEQVVDIVKEVEEKLKDKVMRDRDVWMFEIIQKHRKSKEITALLKLIVKDPECSKELWEEVADICFEVMGNSRVNEIQREQALEVFAMYRSFLKSSAIDMKIEQIPDDILKFEKAGRKVYSKLHGPLHGIDLQVVKVQNEQELNILKEDAITLVAMLQKRMEQVEKRKERVQYFQKIYREPFKKKQMLKMSVIRFKEVKQGPLVFENREVLFSSQLPFKKSDPQCVESVNKIIKKLNQDYSLKIELF